MTIFQRGLSAVVPAPSPAPPGPTSPPKLAGEQVADNTRNVGATLLAIGYVVGIGKEYGIDLLAWADPRWVQFLSDPRVVATITAGALYVGNMYRKSRLKQRLSRLLDGDTPPDHEAEVRKLREALAAAHASRQEISQGRP